MMIPNNTAFVRQSNGFDKYGEPTFTARRAVPCAICQLSMATERTSVRTDSSATRGNAEEQTATAKILFPPGKVAKGWKVEVAGYELRVIDLQPRYAVAGGRHDHDECLLSLWQEGTE